MNDKARLLCGFRKGRTDRLYLVNRCISRVELTCQIIKAHIATGLLDLPFLCRSHVVVRCQLSPSYNKSNCAFSGIGSAKRTPTPIRRTGLPVRANASARSERKVSSVGVSPARSAVVRVKSLNFSFTKIFVISRVDSF